MSTNDHKNITVMVTGAGLSTRLRPLTDNIHKIMLPIAPGLPILEHLLKLMKFQGFENFVINTHYLPHTITDYFGDGKKMGINIAYSHEEELLEVGGGVKKASSLLSDPFILVYGDHLHFFDFAPLLAMHKEKEGEGVITLSDAGDPQDGEVAELDKETGRIVRWHTRPHTITSVSPQFLRNAGLYILSKKIIDYIPSNKKISLDKEVLHRVVEETPLYGFRLSEPFVDIGTPERYQYAQTWYQDQLRKRA
ncbi:MAG: NDP-sugar synthase [Anaplasmataceae bacterium]|nr:NDP-sugar synthase [Anaplasmataceae bacterium]